KIPLILEGGPCRVGVESTVVSLTGEKPVLLRPGLITPAQLEAVLGGKVMLSAAILDRLKEDEKVMSPGMKYKHYAPKANVIMIEGDRDAYCDYVNQRRRDGVMALCFTEDEALLRVPAVQYGEQEDAAGQARLLFTALRRLDEAEAVTVYAHAPKKEGVALAVYNRLLRAAAFQVITL
ncbi:MAG: Sua5 family C-terminal domain-containing protein, partial [Oscillospiraceae bacterium]|nr:Sua5 family C-terminal domain-containing protein [Oscillospiraceae bacterium]